MTAITLDTQSRIVEGDASSAVRVLIFEDMQCPDCVAFREMLDEKLLPRFGARAAFEHRDFPLPKHTWARAAAVAARFFEARQPELGARFRQWTMQSMDDINAGEFEDFLREFAAQNECDAEAALAALQDRQFAGLVERDYQDGVARGVRRTPTVLVGDVPFVERFKVEQVATAIEAALREAGL
ncbi:MAG: thioredoxin domain-containing protein [Bryobacteraceae bacterium]